DPRLYLLQARAYSALGRQLAQHRAQAEAYVRQGNVSAAVEQLQIGLKSGDGDFYQLSSAEARLRELRRLDEELRKESKNWGLRPARRTDRGMGVHPPVPDRSGAALNRAPNRAPMALRRHALWYRACMDNAPAPTAPGVPVAMDKIGKFEIIKELGKGATSAVYQAFDPFMNREVAV